MPFQPGTRISTNALDYFDEDQRGGYYSVSSTPDYYSTAVMNEAWQPRRPIKPRRCAYCGTLRQHERFAIEIKCPSCGAPF